MTDQEKMFEKMLNMKIPKEEMYVQCRNVAHKPITNEEYIRSLTTEELAELLLNAIQDCKSCVSGIGLAEKDDMTCPFGGCWDVKDIVEWLKQPHTPKE